MRHVAGVGHAVIGEERGMADRIREETFVPQDLLEPAERGDRREVARLDPEADVAVEPGVEVVGRGGRRTGAGAPRGVDACSCRPTARLLPRPWCMNGEGLSIAPQARASVPARVASRRG